MNDRDESFVETVPTAVLLEINRLCVEFEQAWRDGQKPRVEDFAARMSSDAQVAAIRELIAQEVELRWAAGQSAEAEEYHQRFPQYPQAVNGAFSLLKRPAKENLPMSRNALASGCPDEPDANAFRLMDLAETDSFVGDDVSDTDDNRPLARLNSHETRPPQESALPERLGRFKFEQWLHAHGAEQDTQLVTALRHCDGGRLQAAVMIRNDFAMAASRFMRALDTRILEGHNFATVDLFDVTHAASVLTKFGQAFGRLPANAELVLGQSRLDGSGGRGWTERSEGSPGVSGWRPPTPATHQSIAGRAQMSAGLRGSA